MTWDLENYEVGTVVYQSIIEDTFLIAVVRGPSSWCAYIGVLNFHLLSGVHYDGLDKHVSCHGGFTYSGRDIQGLPSGYWYFGWDYAHYGDCLANPHISLGDGKKWSRDQVKQELFTVLGDFKKFCALHKPEVFPDFEAVTSIIRDSV